jgi:hypothetical protein
MATIYKIEIELISDWVSYSKDDLQSMVCCWIDKQNTLEFKKGNKLNIDFDKFSVKILK